MVINRVFIMLILLSQMALFETIEFCQKMAIKDCTTYLNEIFQALEERTQDQKFEKCTEFQVSLKKSKSSFLFIGFIFGLKGLCHEDFAVLGEFCAKT